MNPLPLGANVRRPVNLSLQAKLITAAGLVAQDRYGCSFSEMVEGLLKMELKRQKRGILPRSFKPRVCVHRRAGLRKGK